jgi:hypothetical protein
MIWMSIKLGKLLERISEFYPNYYELKQHKLCFDEGCSELLDQRKQSN